MRLKTFAAKSMQEAMTMVRAELGDDAIIVSATSEKKGGIVRVLAATPEAPMPEPETPPAADIDTAEGVDASRLSEVLHHHGLTPALTQALTTAANSLSAHDPHFLLAGSLENVLRFTHLPKNPGQPVLFTGLAGSGKTVSLARVAAQAALAGQQVVIITTDVVRAGAVAQVQRYGELAGVTVHVAEDLDALAAYAANAKASGNARVLIDTPAVNPFHAEDMDELAARIAVSGAEPVLVMAAGGDPWEGQDVAAAFHHMGCARMVATKVDTVRRLGSVLAAAHTSGIALAAAAISPYIGDPLEPLNPLSLARLMYARLPNADVLSTSTVHQVRP